MDLSESTRGWPRHPWERARLSLVRRLVGDLSRSEVLDYGCGDGFIGVSLDGEARKVTCYDPGFAAETPWPERRHNFEYCRTLPDDRYDVVLLLDVLEHCEDAAATLREAAECMWLTSGLMLITVPGWPELYGAHDVALGHHRRYRLGELLDLVTAAGLRIERHGGVFGSLLPLRWLEVQAGTTPSPWRHGRLLTRVVEAALRADVAVSVTAADAGLPLPGLSWWVVASRRGR